MNNKNIVVAHYESQGRISNGWIEFIILAHNYGYNIQFISTRLNAEYEIKIERSCKVIRRNNVGYDFKSYQIGLLQIFNQKNTPKASILINTSIIISNPNKLLAFCESCIKDSHNVRGISINYIKKQKHIQSFFLSFPNWIIESNDFRHWWQNIPLISDRDKVIKDFEIGLSKDLITLKANLVAPFKPKLVDFLFGKTKNPMFTNWVKIEAEIGIYKEQLVRENPFKQDITSLTRNYLNQWL
jgi:rhamnosyltransferase